VLISEGIDPNNDRASRKLPRVQGDPHSGTVDAETEDEMKSVVALANRANESAYTPS
jgi:hypothetical protein